MALIKEKLTRFGIPASYWKVDMITIDRRMQEASFCINLYFNKDAKDYIDTHIVTVMMGNPDKTLFNQYFGEDVNGYPDIYTTCYEFAKNHEDFFKDAIDDNDN